jgi:uncharacterized membrane protein
MQKMRKNEFLAALRQRLSALPAVEREERIGFYGEMIDDQIEEGLSEEEAVDGIGKVEDIANQILSEAPPARIEAKEKRKLGAGVIVLLALGSPIWLSLAVAAFAVLIALYAVLWSLVVSLWAVFVSFAACSLVLPLAGIFFALNGHLWSGLACFSVGIVLIGLSIFVYFGSVYAVKAVVWLTKVLFSRLKNLSVKKEGDL